MKFAEIFVLSQKYHKVYLAIVLISITGYNDDTFSLFCFQSIVPAS